MALSQVLLTELISGGRCDFTTTMERTKAQWESGKNGKCVLGRGVIASAAATPRINNAPPDETLFIVWTRFNFRIA